ncbi:MAG TPA: ATP-binding protein [Solirubrobacteraceae bacterium]|jgi:two-component system NarL family sensor kinase|nr:ATP-binding protein [Solirubrobacteraceae bacterium]
MGEDARAQARCIAALRLGLLPVVVLSVLVIPVRHAPVIDEPAFALTLGMGALWSVVLAWLARSDRAHPDLGPASLLDIALLCALTYESGGSVSQLRTAFFLVPLGVAMLSNPRVTAAWALMVPAAYIAIAAPHPGVDGVGGVGGVLDQALYLGFTGAGAVLLSMLISRSHGRVCELAAARGRLLGETLAAEQRARARLAYELHDGPVQSLLAASRSLARAERGDAQALRDAGGIVRGTVAELRGAVRDLHPHTLEYAGLAGALQELAQATAQRSGVPVSVEIDDGAADGDGALLFAIARELVGNAAAHAAAQRIVLRLARAGPENLLEVIDDGRGISEQDLAVRPGHLGLASVNERALAAGGEVRIVSSPGAGTTIRVRIPLSGALLASA